jgi:hypothetical protein
MSEAVVAGGGVGGRGSPHCFTSLCSNIELVVGSKDMNMEAEETASLEAIIRTLVKTQQTEKN